MENTFSITRKIVQDRYDSFNLQYFNGNLPRIDVGVSRAKNWKGRVLFARQRTVASPSRAHIRAKGWKADPSLGTIRNLKISNFYKMNELEFNSVMLHEMIHVELVAKGVFFTSGGDPDHGTEFLVRRKELELQSGLSIPITTNRDDSTVSESVEDKMLDVFIFERGSRVYLAVFKAGFLSESRRDIIRRMFAKFKNLRFGQSSHRDLQKKSIQRSLTRVKCCEIDSALAELILPEAEFFLSGEQLAVG